MELGGAEREGEEPREFRRSQEEPRGAYRRGEGRSGATEVIKAKGDNKFLDVGGNPHVGVRSGFK